MRRRRDAREYIGLTALKPFNLDAAGGGASAMAVVVTMVLNLLGFVMVAVAVLGLIKGRVPWAHIGNREQAALLARAFVKVAVW